MLGIFEVKKEPTFWILKTRIPKELGFCKGFKTNPDLKSNLVDNGTVHFLVKNFVSLIKSIYVLPLHQITSTVRTLPHV